MTTTQTGSKPAPAGGRTLTLGGRTIPVVLPNRRDPRLHVSAVIVTVQILGQTLLGFKLSIAQILVTIGVCALIEATITLRREHMLVWPASAFLTGNGIALILRASGTKHGDWWSLHGIQFFVLAALLAMLAKHLIRPGGRHVFNPSNVGLVGCLLVIGPRYVFPQYLWWGPGVVGQALAWAVILVGGVWVLRSVRMAPTAIGFLATFAVLVGIFAVSGGSFLAIWHEGPVSGLPYWSNIALSPEVAIFAIFMMTDPQTTPKSRAGRIVFGVATAALAAALLLPQRTEFGIKLAILSSLVVTCAMVPLIEKAGRRIDQRRLSRSPPAPAAPSAAPRRRRLAALSPAIAAVAIIAVAAPVDTLALARNEDVVNIERGITGPRTAQ